MDEMRYAGFWVRVVASIIDTVLVMAIITPLLMTLYGPDYWTLSLEPWRAALRGELAAPAASGTSDPWDFVINWVLPAIAIVVFWIYRSATPGKMILRIRIVDANTGGAPSATRCVVRYLAYYVSMIPLFLGFLWVAVDRRKQGFHDKIAGTLVIHEPPRANPPDA